MKNGEFIIDDFLTPLAELAEEIEKANSTEKEVPR